MTPTRRISACAAVVLLAVSILARPARADAPIVVNSVDDPGTGVCDATQCTLREAIDAANANAGADTINFAIPGAGVHAITPVAGLPTITDPVTIDGYSQPGSSANTLGVGDDAVLTIELNGHNTASPGLDFRAGSSASGVSGLVIRDWQSNGINVYGSAGTVDAISITGNFIGTDVSGTRRAGNVRGIHIDGASGTQIGGSVPAARNLIAGSVAEGIAIDSGDNDVIEGNYIGTTRDGIDSLGNGDAGVVLAGTDHVVGGLFAGEPNIIAFNSPTATGGLRGGVNVYSGTGNTIDKNAIYSNGGLGIALEGIKIPNDPGDGDSGANNRQNFPVITKAKSSTTRIKGTLDSTPSTTFRVQLFANPSYDKKQGKRWIGQQTSVTTDPSGKGIIDVAGPSFAAGEFITATAIAPDGSTSEFSKPFKAV